MMNLFEEKKNELIFRNIIKQCCVLSFLIGKSISLKKIPVNAGISIIQVSFIVEMIESIEALSLLHQLF